MPIFQDNDSDDDVPPIAPPPPGGGDKKAVEVWAAQKGMYPQFVTAPPAALPPGTQPGSFGTVAVNMGHLVGPKANPEYWRFAAAKAAGGWPEGKELTEAEFDEAVKAAGEHVGR